MTLVFKYKRIDRPEPFPSEAAPAIPVTLIGPKEKINVIGLLDSGADFSFIPYDMAEVLGLDLTEKPQDIGGISGTVLSIPSTMKINIQKGKENYTFRVGVYVSAKDMDDDFPILIGRDGFFEQFKITFIEAEKRIHLKKYVNH